jgi:predicted MFS family arabinose efflux permease
MLTALTLAKFAAQTVAGMGASKIVTDIVKNNVTIATTAQKVTVTAGTFVLGSMIFEQSVNHIERLIAEVVDAAKGVKEVSTEETAQ